MATPRTTVTTEVTNWLSASCRAFATPNSAWKSTSWRMWPRSTRRTPTPWPHSPSPLSRASPCRSPTEISGIRLRLVPALTLQPQKRYIGLQREGRIHNTESIRKKFTEALDDLVAQIGKDRSILAAILCGSLSHDT